MRAARALLCEAIHTFSAKVRMIGAVSARGISVSKVSSFEMDGGSQGRIITAQHMIRLDRLETQLIAGLKERVSKLDAIEYALQRFQEELQRRLRDLQERTLKAAGEVANLQDRRRELKARARSLGEAIAKMGHSTTLLQQLAELEGEIEQIDEKLALANQPLDLSFSLDLIRDFVSKKAADFQAAFDAEPARARQILASHIEKLVLTPRATAEGPVYDVTGDLDLFGGDKTAMGLVVRAAPGRKPGGKKGVMQVVARDGFHQ